MISSVNSIPDINDSQKASQKYHSGPEPNNDTCIGWYNSRTEEIY